VVADEREQVAEELRRIREAVRERALLEAEPEPALPPVTVHTEGPLAAPGSPSALAPPPPPDGAAVNAGWNIEAVGAATPGLRGVLFRLACRLLRPPGVLAQVAFNSSQVRYDNDLLAYLDARVDAAHRHYDAILGAHGRHMEEIDRRHLILQEELVAHVHDLAKRIDLVLAQAERGRTSVEAALRELRGRVDRLEERLRQE
jgi:hypothetical protein